ncbi:MAG: NADH-quinone oxidoreductase subunit D [candidate division Zixibacteria bacterium]|nr:NADH-quinone oxidoreductase subunit D [candidate division Zixibacteria bacterium]
MHDIFAPQAQPRYEVDDDDLLINIGPPERYSGAYVTDTYTVNMGPQHPSTHGVLRLELTMDGEAVLSVRPHIGYLHRCFEKHAENLPYPEIMPFTDRMDYIAAMSQNMGLAVAVERLMGLEVPERVAYIRVICCEMQRIASHLVALGTFGLDLGAFTPFLWAFRDREKILDLFEWLSGARMLYNYIWIGGVARDLPEGWTDKARQFLRYFEPKLKDFNDLLSYNYIFITRTANVGILSKDVAISYGVTGPNLRGSGVDWDLRRDDPYSIYDRFDWKVIVGSGEHGPLGSCWDRYMVRINEMAESVKICHQALDQLPAGDVREKLPRKVRPPKGDIYARTETPRGELGYYIVSDGSDVPLRCKVRSPCFTAISALDAIVQASPTPVLIADAVATVGSLDIVLGEIDR